MVSPLAKNGIAGAVGLTVIILAATLGWILFPNIVNSQFVLSKGGILYENWENPPVPIFMTFYLFDCTNSEDILNHANTIPVLEQRGPFTFRETRIKHNVTEEAGGTLTYREVATYYYAPTEGDTPLDIKITTVNPIYITLASLIDNTEMSDVKKILLSDAMHSALNTLQEGPFITHTAEELLFKGWSLNRYINIIQELNATILDGLIPTIPEKFSYFGFFYGRNGSDTGLLNINTGVNGVDEMGAINSWKGVPTLDDVWPTEYCNMLNGTDGEIFPPNTAQSSVNDPQKRIYIFNNDLCRSIYATYDQEETVSGIAGVRMTVPEVVFGNYSANPDNGCYCRSLANNDTSKCFDSGILDLRPCQMGVPLLMSTPHFYQGSEKYVNGVHGLSPNKTLHETFLIIQSATSIVLEASKRIQINLDFQKYKVSAMKNVKDTVFPILWAEESASADQASLDQLKTVTAALYWVDVARWSFLGIGIALTVATTIAGIVLYMKH